jgi:ferredoxin
MSTFNITIDGHELAVEAGQTVLGAAKKLGIDIPNLCYLEKCGPLNSCLVCLVKINGKLVPSCGTKVEPGMKIESGTTEVHEARKTALELLFSEHVGDCLSPCHRLCPLGMNIPVMLRHIQARKFDEAFVAVRDALPMPSVLGRLCHHPCEQGCRRGTWDEAAAIRDLERRVSDDDFESSNPYLPPKKAPSGKSVVIVGAGPAGLSATDYLLRQGHACTVVDRHELAGGSLRKEVDSEALPVEILDAELDRLSRFGVKFKMGVTLGMDVTLDGLLRGFDAVLITVGEIGKADGQALGLEMTPGGIKVQAETSHTNVPGVFAAGSSVKPMNQVVRVMSEGRAAAECIHMFLLGKPIQRKGKPFSNVMGRLSKGELDKFMEGADLVKRAKACDICETYSRKASLTEASRCLHCDCRSSGDCSLQTYAQVYGADASRYRHQRRPFEQKVQPGGVIFEPGKCILCGICVKLTEMAQEELGLTFVGRGFDVRVAAPFNGSIEEGLKKTAAECVEHCPTGALTFE